MYNNQSNNQKEIFTIETGKGQEFRSLVDGDIKKLSNLRIMLSNFFTHIFKDFDGTVIYVNPNSPDGFDVELHFSNKSNLNTKGGITTCFDLVDPASQVNAQNDTIIGKIYCRNEIIKNPNKPIYKMTNDGKEALAKYIYGFNPKTASDKKEDTKWNQVIKERMTQNPVTFQQITTVYVTNLSLSLILRDIFGKFINQEEVQYSVIPIRPIEGTDNRMNFEYNMYIQNQGNNNNKKPYVDTAVDWLVMLYRINVNNLNKVFQEVGFANPTNNGIVGLVPPTIKA